MLSHRLSCEKISAGDLGLLGENTGRSLSPFIHNTSAEILGLPSHYEAYSLNTSELRDFLTRFKECQGLGLNVTNPHKSMVAEIVEEQTLSSVNTLKNVEGVWKAYSTDGEGFWNALHRFDPQIEKHEAFCFLGSGDVLLSILDFMKNKIGKKPVYFVRRGKRNDAALKALYQNLYFLPFEEASLSHVIHEMGGASLCLVQATSAPSYGDDLRHFLSPLKNFQGTFCDLVYGKPSCLYKHLKERGFISLDGLPMLIEQALLAQKIWWGKNASYEDVEEALRKGGFI